MQLKIQLLIIILFGYNNFASFPTSKNAGKETVCIFLFFQHCILNAYPTKSSLLIFAGCVSGSYIHRSCLKKSIISRTDTPPPKRQSNCTYFGQIEQIKPIYRPGLLKVKVGNHFCLRQPIKSQISITRDLRLFRTG